MGVKLWNSKMTSPQKNLRGYIPSMYLVSDWEIPERRCSDKPLEPGTRVLIIGGYTLAYRDSDLSSIASFIDA